MLEEFIPYLFILKKHEWKEYESYYLSNASQTSDLWKEHRKYRLTASNAWKIIKLSLNEINVKEILNLEEKKFTSWEFERINHGRVTESIARKWYENKYNIKVEEIGLLISKKEPFLGCSVDGLVKKDGIIEIKCPFYLYKSLELHVVENKNYNNLVSYKHIPFYHYTQIQLCLYLTKRKWCDYIVYASKSNKVYTERILYDKKFIKNLFLPQWLKIKEEIIYPFLKNELYKIKNNY